MIEKVRRNSVIKRGSNSFDSQNDQNNDIELNTLNNNQFTFSPTKNARRPSILKTDVIKKMHSAIELNKKIIEKSKDSSLVLINIPEPPKVPGNADYNCNFIF